MAASKAFLAEDRACQQHFLDVTQHLLPEGMIQQEPAMACSRMADDLQTMQDVRARASSHIMLSHVLLGIHCRVCSEA